jgi:hypothetical protein
VVEKPSLLKHVEDALGLLLGDIDPDFPHDFNGKGIRVPRSNPALSA